MNEALYVDNKDNKYMNYPKNTPFYISLVYVFLALCSVAFASLPTAVNGQALPSLADMVAALLASADTAVGPSGP